MIQRELFLLTELFCCFFLGSRESNDPGGTHASGAVIRLTRSDALHDLTAPEDQSSLQGFFSRKPR